MCLFSKYLDNILNIYCVPTYNLGKVYGLPTHLFHSFKADFSELPQVLLRYSPFTDYRY